jgi:AraC-like DNA-binding protein
MLFSPHFFINRTDFMDPLTDVLALLQTRSVLSARFEACGTWAMRFSAYRHVKFGGVLEGTFWLWDDEGSAPIKLDSGDFYLLTRGQAYCTGSTPTLAPIDGRQALVEHLCEDGIVRYGEHGNKVNAVGGRFTFDDNTCHLLLASLPPVIHVRADTPSSAPLRATLELLRLETGAPRPGAAVAASGLANLILVHILRAYLDTDISLQGWLGALADTRIGTALTLMHADVAKPWKVKTLAAAVHMSRTSFSERFRALVGVPPLTYLTSWRMMLAQTALRTETRRIAAIAESVGYGSEAAFSTVFKRTMGQSPGQYRSRMREDVVNAD